MRSSERLRCVALSSLLVGVAGPALAGAEPGNPQPMRASEGACPDRGVDALLLEIRSEREVLDRRERLLRERERTEAAAQQETTRRLEELEALRLRVEERLARLDAARDERVARLAALYGRMPADRAAAVLDALDPDLAVQIVVRMPRSRGASVLAALPSARAAEISRRIVSLRPAADGSRGPLAQAAAKPIRTGSGAASVP